MFDDVGAHDIRGFLCTCLVRKKLEEASEALRLEVAVVFGSHIESLRIARCHMRANKCLPSKADLPLGVVARGTATIRFRHPEIAR